MKYTSEVVIDLPRERVIKLFDNGDTLTKLQEGLQSYEHVSGEPGQPGAKSRLVFDRRGRRFEMIETIIERNLPDEFSGTYETESGWNLIKNRFVEEGPDRTRWIAETEYRSSDLMMKLMTIFLRPMFTSTTLKRLREFKAFAESEGRGD